MAFSQISIHALREEGDAVFVDYPDTLTEFLSTPSVRRATIGGVHGCGVQLHFYPRPP